MLNFLKVVTSVALWVSVCNSQGLPDTNITSANVVCRRCPLECVQVQRLDGGCPGCICGGLLLPECPDVDCPNEIDPSCGRQRTVDGCAECVCIPEVEQSPVLPDSIANGGVICLSLPPCPQHCQLIDPTGCPLCDCTGENEVFSDNLPDAVELCPPLPLCPVGCIETELRGEFDCYECNCTLPDIGSTADQGIQGVDPSGLRAQNRPRPNPNDPTGMSSLGLFPADAGPVCGETECAPGCKLCIGRDGCGRCLCGEDSVICPAFPSCPSSCIAELGNGCLTCACSPESLDPRLQSVIIERIPQSLQPEFVADLPYALSPFRSPPHGFFTDGFPFEVDTRPQQLSPILISNIISQFTPDFIHNLPDSVRYQLATELLSIIRPQYRHQLSPQFVTQTSPESLFRTPRRPPQNSFAQSPARRPSFGSPFGNQFPFQNPQFPFQNPQFSPNPQRNPSRIPGIPQNRPNQFPENNPQIPSTPEVGSTFGFPSTRNRPPINNLNYVPSSALRPQGRPTTAAANGFRNGRVPPHSRREPVSTNQNPNLQRQNSFGTNLENRETSPVNNGNDGIGEQRSSFTGIGEQRSSFPDQRSSFTGGIKAPLRRIDIRNLDLGRILEPVLLWL